MTYDARDQIVGESFNIATSSAKYFSYDPDGREVASQNSVGSIVDTFDADGRKTHRSQSIGASAPAGLNYNYYADGMRSSLDIITSAAFSMPSAESFTYQSNGLMRHLGINNNLDSFAFSYTGGERLLTRSDSTGQSTYTNTYTNAGTSPTSIGLSTAVSMPALTVSGITYSAEGDLLNETISNPFQASPNTVSYNYTSRGELIPPTNGRSNISSMYANGYVVSRNNSNQNQTYRTAFTSFNARLSFPVGSDSGSSCGICAGPNDTLLGYSYDSVGRQIGGSVNGAGNEYSKTYDAEDHLLVQAFDAATIGGSKAPRKVSLGYQWGPDHPFLAGSTGIVASAYPQPTDFQYDSLYWDDDFLLYTTNSAGAIDDLKIGSIGDYVPGATSALTVWDRDSVGLIRGCHNNVGNGVVNIGPFQTEGVACEQARGGGLQTSVAPPSFAIAPSGSLIGRGAVFTMPKSDGFSDGFNTFQGVRTYDTQAGVWNTPDAYSGIARDPMSQKPYMWNGNNPYSYNDPTGYEAACVSVNVPCISPEGADAVGKAWADLLGISAILTLLDRHSSGVDKAKAAGSLLAVAFPFGKGLKLVSDVEALARNSKLLENAAAVGSGLKIDSMHRASAWFRGETALDGIQFTIRNGDGSSVTLFQAYAEVNGKKGVVEFIVDANGNITHGFFKPGATIDGIPIKTY
jgi:hypothetical protein